MKFSYKIPVTSISLETLDEWGIEVGDDCKEELARDSADIRDRLLSRLTKRQQAVILQLEAGYSRKETAQNLHRSLQSVHQIILRIRKRMNKCKIK